LLLPLECRDKLLTDPVVDHLYNAIYGKNNMFTFHRLVQHEPSNVVCQ